MKFYLLVKTQLLKSCTYSRCRCLHCVCTNMSGQQSDMHRIETQGALPLIVELFSADRFKEREKDGLQLSAH